MWISAITARVNEDPRNRRQRWINIATGAMSPHTNYLRRRTPDLRVSLPPKARPGARTLSKAKGALQGTCGLLRLLACYRVTSRGPSGRGGASRRRIAKGPVLNDGHGGNAVPAAANRRALASLADPLHITAPEA
jgi:hypothetical protein